MELHLNILKKITFNEGEGWMIWVDAQGPAHRASRPEERLAMQRSASVPFLPGQVVSAGPGERANHRRPQTLIYKLDAPVRATEKLRSANCVKFFEKPFANF